MFAQFTEFGKERFGIAAGAFLILFAALLGCLGCREKSNNLVIEQADAEAAVDSESIGSVAETAPNRRVRDEAPQSLPPEDRRTAGTKKMANWLSLIVRDADPEKTPSMRRTSILEGVRQQLQKENNPMRRAHLGWQLLIDGQTPAALAEFQTVQQEIDKRGLPSDHVFRRNFAEIMAIGYLRHAEQQNCLHNHSQDSCIMPIQGGGIHQLRDGGRAARDTLLKILARDPDDIGSRWLLNLACMTLGEYPEKVPTEWLIPANAFASDYEIGRFRDVAPAAGVDTVGLSGGVVTDDLNGDGLIDIIASDWGVDKPLRLFTNRGDGTFREVTRRSGLEGEWGGLNLVQSDYDNDGHLDVLVLRGAWLRDAGQYPNSLLRNLGDNQFDDVTEQAGLLSFSPTQVGAWADFNRDGLLDLFVGNETFQSRSYPCSLYQNNGDGTFTDVAGQVGLSLTGRIKGAAWGDVNNDGLPDLYLSNFGGPNGLFLNLGERSRGWSFKNISSSAGIEMPYGSFPTWFWDYDNDGWQDILVAPFSGFKFDGTALKIVAAEYLGEPTDADRVHLYRNQRDGTFRNVAAELGIDAPLLAMGANFGDLDNDGFLDCYFGTGDPHFRTLVPNRMFRNDGGDRFQDVTTSGGFGHVQKGHGIGFADFDNDGDEDLYAVMGGALVGDVYQNVLFQNPGHGNRWIALQLEGVRSNRSAIGARIRVRVKMQNGSLRRIYRTVSSGGSFGASSLRQVIGLGDAKRIEDVSIQWPIDSRPQRITGLEMDSAYRVTEGERPELLELPSFRFPEAASPHQHHHAHSLSDDDRD